MTKKIISITLSILLVFSLLVLPVSAEDLFDDTVELALGEKITFDFTYDVWEKYIKFVADKTMTVSVSSETADEKDPYCMVFDADGVAIASADDSDTGYDFICKFEATEGETYYILVAVYDFVTATTVVSLDCGHSYTDGICDDCGEVCTHEVLNAFGECECGQYFEGNELVIGENSFAFELTDAKYYRFIPEETGIYILRSDSAETDPYSYLYDKNTEFLYGADDSAEDYNFELLCYLEEGERYFFEIGDYFENAEWTGIFEKFVHEGEDGEHEIYLEDEYIGTCQELSYSSGIYCADCDEYIYGHEELGYGYHEDFDWDNLCDFCGENLYEDVVDSDFGEFLDFIIRTIEFFENVLFTLLSLFGISESDFSCDILNYIIG